MKKENPKVKFKLKRKLPLSWCVLKDDSSDFKEWVIGYMNHICSLSNNFKIVKWDGDGENPYYGVTLKKVTGNHSRDKFSTVLTIEEFKSHFESFKI